MLESVLNDLRDTERVLSRHGQARLVDATDRPDVDYSFRFDAVFHPIIEFDDRDRAERYRDVYLSLDSFMDLGGGERGVPSEVALADRHIVATYLYATGKYDKDQLADRLDVEQSTIRQYLYRTRRQAQTAETW